MVRNIFCSVAALFLVAGLGNSFGSETTGNIPGQGSGAEVKQNENKGEGAGKDALNWYREHFVLWKVCHEELTAKLGENVKRDQAYLQRAIDVLEKLSRVLSEEKKQDLETYIAQYKQIAGSLKQGLRKSWERKRVQRTLDNLKREVEKKFSYKVVEVKTDLIRRDKEIMDSGKVPRWAGVPPARGKRYRYVADRNSRTFHKVMCIYVSKIKEENRIYFETKKEAGKSGRRLHHHRR